MRTVFFARINGTTGAFQTFTSPTPNPYNTQKITCTPVRQVQGVYTLTFGNNLPKTEYVCTQNLQSNNSGFATNIEGYLDGNILTVRIFDIELMSLRDEDFWVLIQEIGGSPP